MFLVFALCFVISLLFGLAQILSCKGNVAIGFMILFLNICLYVGSITDAVIVSRKQNTFEFEQKRRNSKDPFFAAFVSLLLPGAMHIIHLRRIFLGVMFLSLWIVSFVFPEIPSFAISLLYPAAALSLLLLDGRKQRKTTHGIFPILALGVLSLGLDQCVSHEEWFGLSIATTVGSSNYPTLQEGDLQVSRLKTENTRIARGDLIDIKRGIVPDIVYITKRVVAFENESVEILGGKLTVNGRIPKDSVFRQLTYAIDSTCQFGLPGQPFIVPKNHFFVLGDNSPISLDSRQYGAVSDSSIVGITYKIIWPISRARSFF